MLITFPILSHSNKSFPIQKHPWWGFSNINCLVEYEQVRLKVRRNRLHAACCPLLASLVEDCHGRKAGGPNISCSSFHLECCAQEQVLERLSAHVLLKILIQNLSVLGKLFQNQVLKAPCLGLAL